MTPEGRQECARLIHDVETYLSQFGAESAKASVVKLRKVLALLLAEAKRQNEVQVQENKDVTDTRVDDSQYQQPLATASENKLGPTTDNSDAFTQSFDAREWARAFVEHVTKNPAIATDEGTMIGWFANAIMRGFDEHARRTAPQVSADWNPSEAIYAFAGWLTSRAEPVTMSGHHDAAPVAQLVGEFCKRHSFADPRDNWHRAIIAAPDAGGGDQPPSALRGDREARCDDEGLCGE